MFINYIIAVKVIKLFFLFFILNFILRLKIQRKNIKKKVFLVQITIFELQFISCIGLY